VKRSWRVKFEGQFKHRDESNLNESVGQIAVSGKTAAFAGNGARRQNAVYRAVWQSDNHRHNAQAAA